LEWSYLLERHSLWRETGVEWSYFLESKDLLRGEFEYEIHAAHTGQAQDGWGREGGKARYPTASTSFLNQNISI
jgi:hypothetical protein